MENKQKGAVFKVDPKIQESFFKEFKHLNIFGHPQMVQQMIYVYQVGWINSRLAINEVALKSVKKDPEVNKNVEVDKKK